MSPGAWTAQYRTALGNLYRARAAARAKRRLRAEQRKQYVGGLQRILFIATDIQDDSDAPNALDAIRGIAYGLIQQFEDEGKG